MGAARRWRAALPRGRGRAEARPSTSSRPRGSAALHLIEAARPRTLTAAAVPVLVGSAAAMRAGSFRWLPAAAALAGALLIQIGTNLVNDVADFERGADTAERRGPRRATQSGIFTARQVWAAAWVAFGGAALCGLYLVSVAGWPLIAIGAASIAAGIAYTAGPWPLGYHGLGDLCVFVFFGVVAVAGTYYVQALSVSALVLAASLPVGALATAILVVNNARDIDTDRAAGKHTLAVRLGAAAARREYDILLALAYAVPALIWLAGAGSPWTLLPLTTVPWAWGLSRRMRESAGGAPFNAVLAATAQLHGVFGALFALGIAI